jgi:hypothetical protein
MLAERIARHEAPGIHRDVDPKLLAKSLRRLMRAKNVLRDTKCSDVIVTNVSLTLPHVPSILQYKVRRILHTIIPRITTPSVPGNCYRLAREIKKLGGTLVQYRCGVCSSPLHPTEPNSPHAWNSIYGFVVDLFEEISIAEDGDEWSHTAFCSRCQRRPVALILGRLQARCSHCIRTAHRYDESLCAHCEKRPRAFGLSRCGRCQIKRLKLEQVQRQREGRYNPFSKYFNLPGTGHLGFRQDKRNRWTGDT